MSLRPGGGGRKAGRGEGRTGKYKKSVDALEARRHREEGFVQIRKNKRVDTLSRKRRDFDASSASRSVNFPESDTVDSGPPSCPRHEFSHNELDKINEMAQRLWSEDFSEQIKSASYFGKITSTEENTPIDLVIESGIVPRLIQFLPRQDLPIQQLEAASTLVNISAGTPEHTQFVVDHSVIPYFVQLINSPREEVREKALLALGNIAGNSAHCRDIVLASGVLIPLLSLLNPRSRLMMLRNATWMLSNLFHPAPEIDQIKPAISVLQKTVYSNDDIILRNSCWALAGLFGERHYKMEDIFSEGNICSRLVDLITHKTPSVQMVALKVVANIAAGDDSQTQLLIDNKVLPSLLHLLTQHHHYESSIRRVACRILSNITAGNKSQIQFVIDSKIIPLVVSQLKHAEFNVKKEAAWAILNATSGGTFEQIHFIANQGCICLLCDLLVSQDTEVVTVCLEALGNMLKAGEADKELDTKDSTINVYAREVDDCDGLAKIENLQFHPLISISQAAILMLERYWEGEDDDKDDSDGDGDDANVNKEVKRQDEEDVDHCGDGNNDISAVASVEC